MTLAPGTRLGAYEILSPIGAGGMGEVYRARDAKLERDVALKVLPQVLGADPEALARFQREARAIAALSHPNILAIHDYGEHQGIAYSITELLEGETLRSRLGGGALNPRRAIELALQIASGLAAAHEKGIIHRDLKPENLFVTKDGRVKILDFGLAKTTLLASSPVLTQSPTMGAGTQPGTVMGTMGYMSPEQLRGMAVDTRADIFAFGAILHEMLSGSRAFKGATPADTISAILKEEPADLATGGRSVPPALERIVVHCLEKSPEARFQSARDIAFALEALSGITTAGTAAAPSEDRARPRARLAAPLAGIAVGLLAVVAAYVAGSRAARPTAERPVTFQPLTFRPQAIFQAAAGPDGKTIVFSSAPQGNTPELFMVNAEFLEARSLGLSDVHLLSISSKGEMALLTRPLYIGHRLFRGTLARMPMSGGAPREILEDVRQADWSPDGSDLGIIREIGGKDRLEYPAGKVLHEAAGYLSDMRFSPRGDRIAFFEHPFKWDDRGDLKVVDLSGQVTTLSGGWWGLEGIAWSLDGGEVLFSGGTGYSAFAIYAAALNGKVRPALQSAGGLTIHWVLPDGRWLVTRDDAVRRVFGLAPGASKERDLAWMELSDPSDLSGDGNTLLFTENGMGAGANYAVGLRKMDGSPVVRLGEGGAGALSPDGRWALSVILGNPHQAVLYPTGPGQTRHLDRGPIEQYQSGVFFPDGARVLLGGNEAGHGPRCYAQAVQGGLPQAVTPEGTTGCVVDPTGTKILVLGPDRGWHLHPVSGGSPPADVPWIAVEDRVIGFSADGGSILVYGATRIPAPVERVSLTDGRRTLLREITPANPAGAISLGTLVLSDDEKAYAYSYLQYNAQLFLADGAR